MARVLQPLVEGEVHAALDAFERAYRERRCKLVLLAVEPSLAVLRHHARGAVLLAKMGLRGVD